jgi:hypothetical protein
MFMYQSLEKASLDMDKQDAIAQLYQSAQVAIIEYYRLGGSNNRSSLSEGWQSKIKYWQGWFPMRPLFLDCR